MSVYRRLTVTGKFLDGKFTAGKCLTVNGGKFNLKFQILEPNLKKFLHFPKKFEAKFQVFIKLVHKKCNEKVFESILFRIPNFSYFERIFFTFFKRKFQAKIGFILLPFTDRLPAVNQNDGK